MIKATLKVRNKSFNEMDEYIKERRSIDQQTSTPYVSYDSSAFQKSNLPVAPYCRRVVETTPRQNRTFDPDGFRSRPRACPFLGSWRALVCGEVILAGATGW